MPNRPIPCMSQPLPAALLRDAAELRKAPPAEPVPPNWLILLDGMSRWLNRLFLGLVLALVAFTFWHWWQG
ncbi:MAG: hypothetical protein PGN19_05115 [Pseudomonas oryzihabitans]